MITASYNRVTIVSSNSYFSCAFKGELIVQKRNKTYLVIILWQSSEHSVMKNAPIYSMKIYLIILKMWTV